MFNDLFPELARKRESGEEILDQEFHRFPIFIGLDSLIAFAFSINSLASSLQEERSLVSSRL